ncbi:spore coat protein U domain-containing protein [Sphingomonas insulae]|uniref:spore coat protein U domain-containing protein n=2 Tax=Sphingomonas insulae TaxID=424800 RepID=UPI0030843054
MTGFRWVGMLGRLLAVAASTLAVPAMAAPVCAVTAKVATSSGPYSPAAVEAGKVPPIVSSGGLTCSSALLVLLGSNSIKATFASLNDLKLKGSAGDIVYTASADPNGTVPLTQNKTTEYMQNNVLNALGLLGSNNGTLPVNIKLASGVRPAPGRYTDTITMTWDWRICNGISALVCVGSYETPPSPVKSDVTVTLDVTPQDMTITLTSAATWDATNGTARPLAVPGSKGRTTLAVRNPDLVALDNASVALIYKVPARTSVILDGDGTTSSTVIGFTDGSPSAGVTLSYVPGSATDDVDFSADNGVSWTYSPVAGNRASEGAITQLRFRPKGAMKAGGAFSLSFPYLLR